MPTQAHAAHLNASLNFGINITCASCHGTSAQTANTHANGTVNFTGFTHGVPADAVVALTGGTFGACGVNACHNDGTGVTQQSNPLWTVTGLTCVNCHQDTTGMITNAHNEHTPYTNALCTD